MTADEREAARALAGCRYLPGSFEKRFARDVAALPAGQALTDRQAAQLWRQVLRYRRQLPGRVAGLILSRSDVPEVGVGAAMTEDDWRTLDDPRRLLAGCWRMEFWSGCGCTWRDASPPDHCPVHGDKGKWFRAPSAHRDVRLFLCAVCRAAWARLTDANAREAVEAAERFALGEIGFDEFYPFWSSSHQAWRQAALKAVGRSEDFSLLVLFACEAPQTEEALEAALLGVGADYWNTVRAAGVHSAEAAGLLRDAVCNPFRPYPFSCPHCAGGVVPTDRDDNRCEACGGTGRPAWVGEKARQLAQSVRESMAYSELGILADVLEESGCDDRDVLDHLRGPGPHSLGCWALRGVLGKG